MTTERVIFDAKAKAEALKHYRRVLRWGTHRNISRGTSIGMRRYWRTVPKCQICETTRTHHKTRICAKCRKRGIDDD